jgi:methionine aminotransferase
MQSKLPNTKASIFSVMTGLANEHGAINLAQGFPDFDCDDHLQNLVYKYMREHKNQYAPMAGYLGLLEAIAEKLHYSYQLDLDPSLHITITAGATQAIYTAISACVRPGDEVIVLEPAYDSYRPSIEINGGIVVTHELSAPDFNINWDGIRSLITGRTRMIIINNPHNPTGSILDEEDLDELEEISVKNDLIVLSDEVYEHIIFDGKTHQSVLRRPALFEQSFACFSFGKTFHITGWKIGYIVGGKTLMNEFKKLHQFTVFCVNHPIQRALADFLTNGKPYETLPSFFQEKRDLFASGIEKSRFNLLPSRGSYFINVDYSNISDSNDFDFAYWMTKEFKLASIPLSSFYSNPNNQKILRFCFAKTEQVLLDAIDIMQKI